MSIDKLFSLKGKVAAITGGHSGIGKGIAEGLAEAGADIVIAGRRLELCQQVASEISAKTGVKSLPLRCDITRTEDADNLIATTVKEFGKVDIMVNSAGISGVEKPVIHMTDEDWDKTLNTDLRGTFLCSRAAAREMLKRNEGKIINVASMYGVIATRYEADYCASKGGVIQLTKVMALELARNNIQVNVICPGYFNTPMNSVFFSSEAGKKIINNSIPLRRLGNTDELKGIAVYLASPASSFTIGATMVVDGGQGIW